MKYFGTLWKKLRRKIVIPPPLLSIKYFSLPATLWNTEWFPGEVFSVLWEKQYFDETVKLPPSLAWNFSIAEIFRNTEVYRHWETNKSRWKILILPPPSLLSKKFFDTGKLVKQRRDPPRSFSVLWDNKVSIENRYILLLGIKFLDTRISLKHGRVPRRNFSPLWDKLFFNRKSWHPFA